MAYRIAWTESARQDLEDIVRYIADDNKDIARKVGMAIIEKAESVAAFPESGRKVPELQDSKTREIILPPYRIIYELDKAQDILFISRIWHAARGIPELGG